MTMFFSKHLVSLQDISIVRWSVNSAMINSAHLQSFLSCYKGQQSGSATEWENHGCWS